ncbi:MAG TPA: protease modulator HflC [Rectinema sp.]|jgi:membrane protease subunit HflC|nr:protease modulator HflC [Rectinema sp.]HOH04527.1 protease modulator HflC [Rectinema sp.]HOM91702.1 protease modulator HflC [Rectinema sp.]HOR47764.1 protease modulator HflC [Rectinema sp.]HOU05874.1 protease modulator HflC [Rectinema sp.]
MKKTSIIITIVVALGILFIIIFGPLFVLNEGEQAVVVRFGKIVAFHTSAGLKWRSPFVDTVMKYPKKLMSWDGEPQRIPTKENQFIYVDTTARWRIVDPIKFYESVNTLDGAFSKLSDVIDSAVRTVISSNYLREAVRSSDEILSESQVESFQTGDIENNTTLQQLAITQTQYEKIEKGRLVLAEEMKTLVSEIVPSFGIEVVDILPRQIKYSDELSESVYQRMIKERNQIAQAFRAYGEGKKAEWLGKLENEKRTILSSAYAKGESIKGKADAEASKIYADSFGRDPSFFEFWKAIESYRKTMPAFNKTLSTGMDYFKYLYSPTGR